MKNVSLCNDQCEACQLTGQMASQPADRISICGKSFKAAVFLDIINVINVKLFMMVVLTDLYPDMPLSVTLMYFRDTSVSDSFH